MTADRAMSLVGSASPGYVCWPAIVAVAIALTVVLAIAALVGGVDYVFRSRNRSRRDVLGRDDGPTK